MTKAKTVQVPQEPPLVATGAITEDEFRMLSDTLRDAQATKDFTEYAAVAAGISMGNPVAFGSLFLGRDPLRHMVEVQRQKRGYQNNLDLISRSHSKSTCEVIDDIIHDICFSLVEGSGYENPRILLLQETKPEAEKTIAAVKGPLVNGGPNGLIHLAFLAPLGLESFKQLATRWTTDSILLQRRDVGKDYTLYGVGADGAVTGAHPRKVKADDLCTKNNSRTRHQREQLISWWLNTANGMFDPATKIDYVATPKYAGDLTDFLKNEGSFNVIKMPALSRMPAPGDFEPIEDEKGVRLWARVTESGRDITAIWPCPAVEHGLAETCEYYLDPAKHEAEWGEHRSVEWIAHKFYFANYPAFCSEIMLTLVGSEQARISPGMLRFYSFAPEDIGKEPSDVWSDSGYQLTSAPIVPFLNGGRAIYSVDGWDHAIGTRRHHDETSLTKGYRTDRGECFFRVRAGRWPYDQVWGKMVDWYLTDEVRRADIIATEGVNFQEIFGGETRKDLRIPPDKVQSVPAKVDKDTALVDSQLLNLLIQGKGFFDIRDKETINQLLTFTPDAKDMPDDRVDSTRICYSYLRKPLMMDPILGVGAGTGRGSGFRGGVAPWRNRM